MSLTTMELYVRSLLKKHIEQTLLDRHCVAYILSHEKLQSKTSFSQYSNSFCISIIEIFH
jgi:hypothetical protein